MPGKVFHAGTYNANPLCVAAAYASLTELDRPSTYQRLQKIGSMLQEGLTRTIEETCMEAIVQGVGHAGASSTLRSSRKSKPTSISWRATRRNTKKMHKKLLKRGVYFHPQQYEYLFICTQHTE